MKDEYYRPTFLPHKVQFCGQQSSATELFHSIRDTAGAAGPVARLRASKATEFSKLSRDVLCNV